MSHLFNKLNPNFFNILSSPNKRTYVDCLFIIYNAVDSIEESFQGDREYVVQRLIDYFDDIQDEEFEDQMVNNLTSRQKSVYVINLLKNTGWLGEEDLGDYKTSLNLFDYSIKMISVLDDIVNERQDEYTGDIFSIYTILNSFKLTEGVGIIEQAYKRTNELIKKLKTLKANIYRYYHDIIREQSKEDLQNILERLLVEYKQNFFDSAYYNLKTKDSLPRYKSGILNRVSNIYNNVDTMDELAKMVMEDKRIEDYNEAFDYLEVRLRFIIASFNALDNLISDIDRKNEQYISATASKILFLTNHSDDIEGIFNRLFKLVLEDDEFNYNEVINLSQIKNLDTESLYNERRVRIDSVAEELFTQDDFLSPEEKRMRAQSYLKGTIYSRKEINKYVLEALEGKEELLASDLLMEEREDFVRLLLIFLYSKSDSVDYLTESLKIDVNNKFVTFKDFKIKSKVR